MLKNCNTFFKTTSCAVILCATSVSHAAPLQLESSAVYAPERLGSLSLMHDENGFHVLRDNKTHHVQHCFTDPMLRHISKEQLEKFLHNGYVAVSRMSDNEYALSAHGRLPGDGPIAGAIAYWATKSLCYGTAAAAATTAVVVTGGAAGALTGGLAAASTLGLGAGASVAGGVIAGAGAAQGAALLTAGAVTGAGGIAGAIAAVETASLGVSALFTMCPFLP